MSTTARSNLRTLIESNAENFVVQKVLQLTPNEIRFQSKSVARNITDKQSLSLYKVYKILDGSSRHRDRNIAQGRIQAVAFYTMSNQFGQDDHLDNLKHYLRSDFNDAREKMDAVKLRAFVRSGQRLKTIADCCGGLGALLMIPDKVLTVRQ